MGGASAYLYDRVVARETHRLSWALKYTVQTPGLDGLCIGTVLGLSAGSGWKHIT